MCQVLKQKHLKVRVLYTKNIVSLCFFGNLDNIMTKIIPPDSMFRNKNLNTENKTIAKGKAPKASKQSELHFMGFQHICSSTRVSAGYLAMLLALEISARSRFFT